MSAGSKRDGSDAHLDDQIQAERVLRAAEGLAGWRRVLVKRRCRLIFGRYWTDLAELAPIDGDNTLGAFAPHVSRSWQLQEAGRTPDTLGHLYQRAYSEDPGHRLLRKLRRQLWLLHQGL